MGKDKITVAVVGYGGMAAHHVNRMRRLEDKFTIAGVYDISKESNDNARINGLHIYDSYEAIALDSEVDSVLIATPNDVHAFYAEYFARAGKDIICEKPAAMNSEEFIKMSDCAAQYGVKLIVHQNRRWDKDYLTVKKLVEEESVGEVYYIESRVLGEKGIPGGWRKQIKHGGGMMLDWGVHLIDQALDLIKEKIVSIYCNYSHVLGFKVEDGFKLLLTFKSGLKYLIVVDTNSYVNLPRWQVYGRRGTASVTDWDLNGKIVVPDDSVKDSVNGIIAGNGYTKTMARRSDSKVELQLPSVSVEDTPFYSHYYRFIRENGCKKIEDREVLRVLRVMELAQRAATTNQVIKQEI